MRAAIRAGITVVIAKTWLGTRRDERSFKNQNSTPQHCPYCKKGTLARKAAGLRANRANKKAKAVAALAVVA